MQTVFEAAILYIVFNAFSKAYISETKWEFWLNSWLIFFISIIAYADFWGAFFRKVFELGFNPVKILGEYAAIVFISILIIKSQIKSVNAKTVLLVITPILSIFVMAAINALIY